MALPSMEQRQFTLAEIRSATGDFSPENLIGEGGFGEVFKAAIGDGTKLAAVKRLKRPAINERLARQGFAREIEALTQLRHRHIVSLIGYCSEQGEMILVYEYIANGTLEDHLHGKAGDRHSLTWTERLSICIGACRGLDYLHSSCPGNSIIHADVKSSNILLDENLVAKVSDFGSAKQINADVSESSSSTAEMYSRGYLDPLADATGRFTMGSDVYSFGVVMLEVVSERRADSRPQNDDLLSVWAVKKFRKGKGSELVASSLSGEISKQCRSCFLGIVERCLQREAEKRPTITEVLALLITALGLQQERPDPTRWFWQSKVSPKEVISSADLAQDNVIREDELEHLPAIPLAEFQDITGGFSSKFLIAKRSTGVSLFRGVLKTGQDAAIKRFKKKLSEQEFIAQVSKISRLQHKNVVQPLGYCVNGDQQLLAFEFAPYGSLHDIFHDKNLESSTVVPWVQRIKIAVGAAKGLEYIHENGLIHHSIKSSNILLFEDGNAKISDVSLSIPCPCKPARGHKRYPEQAPCGCCYHPPECVLTNRTQKGDVYSFGVVLLEILTGQKATQPLVQQFLAILHEATETPVQREEEIKKVVDDRLGFGRKCSASAVLMMAEVALLCLAKEADSRPDMSTVLIRLERASWETQVYVRKHEQQ
ncbi:probable serine/threonine-protein kinase PBL5 isoform X1 [Salvia hispanica]|uniref:probable serine/threonine-protein kinase PBL5 isoform X1 n=1 Tax=Salvia hispanica TaxID=49212 RepID=UPI0020091F32|nr:probable serine/threonine-protein kinase PBL5 isoform X1 [Salvia hispanica]XP_047953371.1 probable serine/threonine-protein kinase PBL5 isoform X1 [Salvia hispanica]XP_047953798.1 probable serine/threonine-protein kinase PBL5 isoform X1 [Salvia hispanica]XP_047954101.1 probable serine/threonine-protein kinase PBL5 isoform X1 [Salvia hispanica]